MARLPYSKKKSVEFLREADPRLAAAIDAVGPFKLTIGELSSPLEALIRSITFQSVSTKAASTIHGRVIDVVTKGDSSGGVTPEMVTRCPKQKLRDAGLSWAKVEAIRDLARLTKKGVVPDRDTLLQLDDDEIIERICTVRGVGRWTVEMLLIFSLGRPDVLPATDLGVRKGYARVYGFDDLPSPKAILEHGEAWKPYRSVASWYFWRAGELPAELELGVA